MVATSHPTPLAPRTYSPHAAAAVLGIGETTIRNQLRAAPHDERQRVTDGPWAGAYRRGTHWKVPAAVVRRMAGSKVAAAPATDLERRLTQAEVDIARCKEAICAAFRALYPDGAQPGGAK